MTFEEFFKKKKISLVALEQGEPDLFSEFKVHFQKMGERSFDHTKKYWFNKLRLRFPAPVEPKVEKVVMENPLAEQTVNETLSEKPDAPPANAGFKPRFKAGMTKPAGPSPDPASNPDAEKPGKGTEILSPSPAVGFKPRFKAGATKATESVNTESIANSEKPAQNDEPPAPPVGFRPRFKAGTAKPSEPAPTTKANPEPAKPAEESSAQKPPALGFKPKFRTGATKPANQSPEQNGEEEE